MTNNLHDLTEEPEYYLCPSNTKHKVYGNLSNLEAHMAACPDYNRPRPELEALKDSQQKPTLDRRDEVVKAALRVAKYSYRTSNPDALVAFDVMTEAIELYKKESL